MKKFWLVWALNGGSSTYKHESEESAMREAERLARVHKPIEFVVLESVSSVKISDVQWVKHESEQEIPF
jgi:ADP-ribose pyrophosphatase YjhB (NUDIX family)